ncbi:hypothetical protein D9O50_17720 [Oxalobacteraceae bacterium CAVE-383]|nr:hypothetical protein D9O50_17720 [Oxalobacteraceae bacterium CAVE-383]
MSTLHSLYRSVNAGALAVIFLAAGNAAAETADMAPAPEAPGPWTVTKHIDLASRYVLRGATTTYGNGAPLGNSGGDAPESSSAALQWGFDAVHSSGWSFGYWASTINYSYEQLGKSYADRSITDFGKNKSIENDFYGAYSGNIAGDLGYTLGGTGYYYINGSHANALETKAGLTYGELAFNAQTLLNDTVWGNKGDTYWTAVWTKPIMWGLTFTGTLGAYTYKKEGKYLGTTDTATGTSCAANESFVINGCFAGNRPSSGGFRHLTLAVGGPIGSTPVSWNVQGIIGGQNRFGIHQNNRIVGMLSLGF